MSPNRRNGTMKDRIVAGRYELRGLIGQGGTARVFRAFDRVLGREVAIKIVDERAAFEPVYLERFKREAQAAARLNHPNIVTIHDWGEARSDAGGLPTYFMVMEHVEGADLGDLIARRGPLPIPEALSYADAIAAALQAAHAQGIVHRDVKPQNVMIQPDGRVKVTDFGIARRLDLTPLTEPNMVSGTAQYLAPEQARGGATDARSDLYSLGIVLYEMLTGKTPFGGGSPVEVAMKHVSEIPSPSSRLRPDVPAAVDALVMRALAKKPEDRFASLSDFRSALATANRSEPAAPPSRPPAVRRQRVQSRTAIVPVTRGPRWEQWTWIVLLLVVLLAGGLAYGVVSSAFNSHGRHVALHHGPQVAAKSTATATTPVPTKTVKSSPTAKPSRTVKSAPVTVKHPPTVAKPSPTHVPPTPIPATATSRPAVAAGTARGAAPRRHASPAGPPARPRSTPP